MTGDIATSGLRSDLKRALDFFEGEPADPEWEPSEMIDGMPTLKALKDDGVKLILLPGNHDRFYPWKAYLDEKADLLHILRREEENTIKRGVFRSG